MPGGHDEVKTGKGGGAGRMITGKAVAREDREKQKDKEM